MKWPPSRRATHPARFFKEIADRLQVDGPRHEKRLLIDGSCCGGRENFVAIQNTTLLPDLRQSWAVSYPLMLNLRLDKLHKSSPDCLLLAQVSGSRLAIPEPLVRLGTRSPDSRLTWAAWQTIPKTTEEGSGLTGLHRLNLSCQIVPGCLKSLVKAAAAHKAWRASYHGALCFLDEAGEEFCGFHICAPL